MKKLTPEEKEKRRFAREESKKLKEQQKEEALRLEKEEFFKEFPWKILEILKTAQELSIAYSITEVEGTGEMSIRFEFPLNYVETIRFHPQDEQSTVVYNSRVWELENLEFRFDSVRRERDEKERKQKLRQEVLSKLSKEEKEALGL